MSLANYVQKSFAQGLKTRSQALRERITKWRRTPPVVRVERPLNPPKARSLGYKATRDFIVVRSRIARGKRRRRRPDLGRKPGKNRKTQPPGRSLREMAEQRAAKRYPNLKLVNSYYVGSDGQYKFYEVIFKNLN